ncbi:MAG: hypothetical protein ABIT71_01185 [Vicinamibacteraceae bacterium]
MDPSRRIERTLAVFASPEEAEAATRRGYREMTPNERVSLTVELQRRYYQRRDPGGRLQRILTVLDRA